MRCLRLYSYERELARSKGQHETFSQANSGRRIPQVASTRVLGYERTNGLRDALQEELCAPFVALRAGRVTAYLSAATFWQLNHGVAETEEEMQALLLGAAAASEEPLSLLVPSRQTDLLRWCLCQGLRVVKPVTLMVIGAYREPIGCFFPSIEY
jgi:hypothetical protein